MSVDGQRWNFCFSIVSHLPSSLYHIADIRMTPVAGSTATEAQHNTVRDGHDGQSEISFAWDRA